jgi:hypothetical protein
MANEFKHKDPGAELTQAEFIASDGTGHIFDSQAAGDILYALSTTALARLAKGSDGTILELASGVPAWTASPTIGSTSWANATHAHAASNSGGTLTALGTIATGVWEGTAIATGYIAADAITGAKIADDAIDSEHYTDGSIDAAHLAADAVTGAKIADDAIDSEHYTDGSIDNAHLADDAVDSDELAAGAVDTAHIGDNQVTVAKIEDIARGSIIYGNASAASVELTKGGANEVLTSDGTDIAWAAASSGAISRSGGQLSEATSTSTSSAILLTSSTLAIPAVSPFNFILSARKTTGAADDCAFGWGMTVSGGSDVICRAAITGNNAGWFTSTANENQNGMWIMDVAARLTNYTSGVQAYSENKNTSSGANRDGGRNGNMTTDAIMPIGVVVEVIVYGISDNGSNTVAGDELNIYEAVTS